MRNLNNFKINFDHIDFNRLEENWKWLIGTDKKPILMTSIGDLFFVDKNENYYWLNVGEGVFEKVAENTSEFEMKLTDGNLVDEWFLIDLVEKIKESGLILEENKLYSYKTLPILGGKYEVENFELIDIEIHFELCAIIHQQIKKFPDGTEIVIKTI